MVELKPVTSSMIAAQGYDATSRTLAVRFHNSAFVHHFRDVPPEQAAELAGAESIGKAFNAQIRGKFESTIVRVDEDDAELVTKDGKSIDTAAPWRLP